MPAFQTEGPHPRNPFSRRTLLSGALGLGATVAGVAGCTGSNGASQEAGRPVVAPSVTPAAKKAGIPYPEGYVGPVARELTPITTEKTTFTIVVPQDVMVGDWSKNAFTQWLERATGIRIKFRQVAGAGSDMMTKVNAMIAAGDLPDAFLGVPFTRTQLYIYGQQGLFIDQSPHIDAYALNLRQMVKDYPGAEKLMVTPDKKIYSFPDLNDCYHCRSGAGRSWIHTGWLDKVGLAMPQNTEEFREVLTAFKKADPAGGGRTIPFGSQRDVPLDTFFMNAFLYNPGAPWLVVNDGKVDVTYTKDEWREGLRYLRGLYGDGLFNKDVFTATGDQYRRYGTAAGGSWLGGSRGNFWGDWMTIDEKNPNAEWREYEALPSLEGPNGVRFAAWDFNFHLKVSSSYPGVPLVITKNCQRPDLLVRWADAQLDLEAILRKYAGPNWEWAKKGELGINGKQALYGLTATWGSSALTGKTWAQYGPMYRSSDFRLGERINPKQPTFEKPLYEQSKKAYEPHKQPPEQQFPPVTYTADQAAVDAETRTNLEAEVRLSLAKFVTGQLDVNDDGTWKDYLQRIERIGVKTFLDTQQLAYEEFQS